MFSASVILCLTFLFSGFYPELGLDLIAKTVLFSKDGARFFYFRIVAHWVAERLAFTKMSLLILIHASIL
jgi:hypothetical protein